ILDLARVKAARAGRRLVVTGCLAQRYADELRTALPEVDVFVGTGDLLHIADAVEAPVSDGPVVYRGAQHVLPRRELAQRVRAGAWWTAYLKVSEGCDHTCSFCIIPKIRGRHESRPMDDVRALCDFLEEAEFERVGVFTYSREEGTAAATLPDQVAEAVKRERRARVMAVQAGVAARRAAAQVGLGVEVLVEEARGRTLVG